jgi:peptidyl-prolyl cis-trans isomerase B (cyclophilin B)
MKSSRLLAAILAILLIGAMILQTGCDDGPKQNPQATVEMMDGTKFTIELLPEYAPNTVNNFLSLAEKGEYDGTFFHRILPDLNGTGNVTEGIIQGGAFVMDNAETGEYSVRETGYSIKAEVINNGFAQNTLKHEPGVISMARTSEYDSGSNQFFIMTCNYPSWDGEYCGFGRVTEGLENVQAIIQYAVDNGMDNPSAIKTVTVETFGEEWPEPETIQG